MTEVTYLGSVWGTMALRYMKPRDRGVIVQVAAGLAALGRFSKNGSEPPSCETCSWSARSPIHRVSCRRRSATTSARFAVVAPA